MVNLFRIFAVLALAIIIGAANAVAFDCDKTVNDDAGIFKNENAVLNAAKRLEAAGPVVKVLTVKNFGDAGNIDRYIDRIQKDCPSWLSPDGFRRANILIFVISMKEREAGIYYGENYRKALAHKLDAVRTDEMTPNFRLGDFDQGFISAIDEVERILAEYSKPAKKEQPSQPSKPVDLSGLWSVLGWSLGIITFFVLLFFLYRYLTRLRQEREKKTAARQAAALERNNCANLINKLSDVFVILESKVGTLKGKISDKEYKPITDFVEKAKSNYDHAVMQNSDLAKSQTLNPDNENLSASEYETIEKAFTKVLNELKEASVLVDKVNKTAEETAKLIAETPEHIKQTESLINSSWDVIAKVKSAGFKTSKPEESLAKTKELLSRAKNKLVERNYSEALKLSQEAEKLTKQAVETARGFTKRKEELEKALEALKSRIPAVQKQIIEGKKVFDKMAENFAESSWESVKGNGTESVNRVDWSLKAVGAAAEAISMENQDWDKGQEIIKEANNWLDEAESFMRSIHARASYLEIAKRDAPKEIEAAENDIKEALDYIEKYDPDIGESLEDELKEAQKTLAEAKKEIAKSIPDYSKTVKLAQAANKAADDILAQARGEHEEAERLRRRVASALRDAERTISKAKEYIEDHSSDVDSDADNLLEEAKKLFAKAGSITDIALIISLAEHANSKAGRAYELAKEDVSDAESTYSHSWGSSRGSSYSSGSSDDDDGGSSSGGWFSDGGGGSSGGFGGGGGGGSSGSW